jgi:molybdopterin-biosynthesis enzyme MoeA-like protein
LGIALKRIEVIADDEGEIVEAVRRMSKNYDFVVTSGGIGPTLVLLLFRYGGLLMLMLVD